MFKGGGRLRQFRRGMGGIPAAVFGNLRSEQEPANGPEHTEGNKTHNEDWHDQPPYANVASARPLAR